MLSCALPVSQNKWKGWAVGTELDGRLKKLETRKAGEWLSGEEQGDALSFFIRGNCCPRGIQTPLPTHSSDHKVHLQRLHTSYPETLNQNQKDCPSAKHHIFPPNKVIKIVTGWPQHWPGSMQPNVVQKPCVLFCSPPFPDNFSQVLVTRLPIPKVQVTTTSQPAIFTAIHNLGIYSGKLAAGQALATHVWPLQLACESKDGRCGASDTQQCIRCHLDRIRWNIVARSPQ